MRTRSPRPTSHPFLPCPPAPSRAPLASRPALCQDSDVVGCWAVGPTDRTGRRLLPSSRSCLGASTRPTAIRAMSRRAMLSGVTRTFEETRYHYHPSGEGRRRTPGGGEGRGTEGNDDAVLRNWDGWNYATQCKHGQPRQISFMLSTHELL